MKEPVLPAGSVVRIGVPEHWPKELIAALKNYLSGQSQVRYACLGFMETIDSDRKTMFAYTIGIKCLSDEERILQQAAQVVAPFITKCGPIFVGRPTSDYFTEDAIVFFGINAEKGNWLHRLMYREMSEHWANLMSFLASPFRNKK